MPGGRPTRSTRWRRRPARGTAWRSDAWPGGSSRTRILRWNRAGLPSEPGRGFFQNLPLLAEDLVLAPEPPQLLALFRGQAILAVAVVAIGLGNPVADRLRRRLELLRQLFPVPPGSHHLNEPPLELRRVRWSGLGHRELLFPRKGSGVHETGGTSVPEIARVIAGLAGGHWMVPAAEQYRDAARAVIDQKIAQRLDASAS